MKCIYSREIQAPVEKVFDLIQDPEKHKLWLDGVEETRYEGNYDPSHPVGTKFKQRIREGGKVKEYDGEITAFARPTHLAIRLSSPQFSVDVDYRLTAVDRGTHLDYAADVHCNSWIFRIMGWFFRFFTKWIVGKQMRKLKELAESGV